MLRRRGSEAAPRGDAWRYPPAALGAADVRIFAPLSNPVRFVPLLFLAAIGIGTVLLLLPIARAGPGAAPPITALFTATSAVSVTGLITVDTATYWTPFGQAVILLLFQIGGFGIMTAAVVLGLVAERDIRLRDRIL